jgi:hypothetical protein
MRLRLRSDQIGSSPLRCPIVMPISDRSLLMSGVIWQQQQVIERFSGLIYIPMYCMVNVAAIACRLAPWSGAFEPDLCPPHPLPHTFNPHCGFAAQL